MRKRRRGSLGRATPWQRRRRRILLVFSILCLLLTPALVWRLRLRGELDQRLAELRAQGMPTTLQELAAWDPQDPKEAEADAAYVKVFTSYVRINQDYLDTLPKFERGDWRLVEVPFSPETTAALKARVEGNEAMLTALRDASEFPRYRLARDNRSLNPAMKDLSLPLEVLCAQICLLAESGDGNGALDLIKAGVRCARACRATPFMEALNKSVDYEAKVMSVLPAVVVRTPISPEKVAEIDTLISEDSWATDFPYCINGDRCRQLYYKRLAYDWQDTLFALAGYNDRELLHVIDFFDCAPEVALYPYRERERFLHKAGYADWYIFWRLPYYMEYSPPAIAIYRYYQANGAMPDTLDLLAPTYLDAKNLERLIYIRDPKVDTGRGGPKGAERRAHSFEVQGVLWPKPSRGESG